MIVKYNPEEIEIKLTYRDAIILSEILFRISSDSEVLTIALNSLNQQLIGELHNSIEYYEILDEQNGNVQYEGVIVRAEGGINFKC